MTTALSVNLNKIALLRNSRAGDHPSVLTFAQKCLDLGVQGLTVHPRPDQRHIRPKDVTDIAQLIAQYPSAELNIEGNPTAPPEGDYPGLLGLAERAKPSQCTLVPDSASQLTSDHGFDLITDGDALRPIIARLKSLDIRVSLFMEPDIAQIELAKAVGADRIELYSGPFAWTYKPDDAASDALFQKYRLAAMHAQSIGLGVNAGHDLNLDNLPCFTQIPGLLEVSIGHALTVDALVMGWDTAINAYLSLCK